jgi:O-antigen/teichoic acid export membrane protein
VEQPLFALFRMAPAPEVYLLILLSCALQNSAAMFLAVFKGVQRMDKSNAIEITMSLINAAGIVFFLEMGFGIFGLALNALISVVLAVVITGLTVKRQIPEISLRWRYDGKLLREMCGYGAKLQVSRLGGLICFQFDKVIISWFLGIAAVSFYEVSSRLASFMRAIPVVMLSALIPATSELDARNDQARIFKTYILASRYVAMVTIALVAFFVLEAGSLVTLWLGRGFDESVVLVQILAIGYGVNALGGAASQTGAGVGRPEFDMRSTVLLMIVNPILSLFLIRNFGAPGAAAGTSISLVVAAFYLLFMFHRKYVNDSVWAAVREIYARPFVSATLATVCVLVLHQASNVQALADLRYLVPLKLLVDSVVFAPIYVALLIAFRQVTVLDWKNFVGLMAFGLEFLRHPSRERVKIYR